MIWIICCKDGALATEWNRRPIDHQYIFYSCEEALNLLDTPEHTLALPNVLIVETALPGLSGAKAVRELKSRLPETPLILFASREDTKMIYDALIAGAVSYVFEDEGPWAFDLERWFPDGPLMPAASATEILALFSSQPLDSTNSLTEREQAVLTLAAKRLTRKMIQDKLFIGRHTLSTHVRFICEKLQHLDGASALIKELC